MGCGYIICYRFSRPLLLLVAMTVVLRKAVFPANIPNLTMQMIDRIIYTRQLTWHPLHENACVSSRNFSGCSGGWVIC